MSKVTIESLGAETGNYLSHTNSKLFLQNGIHGEGELWNIHFLEGGVSFEALGEEEGKFLSYANGKVSLKNGIENNKKLFALAFQYNGNVALHALGEESGKCFSHQSRWRRSMAYSRPLRLTRVIGRLLNSCAKPKK